MRIKMEEFVKGIDHTTDSNSEYRPSLAGRCVNRGLCGADRQTRKHCRTCYLQSPVINDVCVVGDTSGGAVSSFDLDG